MPTFVRAQYLGTCVTASFLPWFVRWRTINPRLVGRSQMKQVSGRQPSNMSNAGCNDLQNFLALFFYPYTDPVMVYGTFRVGNR